MAYINININELELYYTQKGREYIMTGDTRDYQIKFFSLGDSDVNYFIENIGKINTDLSGTGGNCLKSVADGVDIALPILVEEIPLPVVGFVTDGTLVQIGNDSEQIRVSISDGIPRNYDVKVKLNCNILTNLQWFNLVEYKNIQYSSLSDFSDVIIDIPAGRLDSDIIIFNFNPLIKPNPLPNENISVLVQIVEDTNVRFVESPITIVRQQPQITIDVDIQTNRFACGDGGSADFTVIATGGIGQYLYTLIDSNNNTVTSNSTGLFNNILVGTYTIRVVDSQGNERIVSYEIVAFPLSTAIITNTQDITPAQTNGSVTVQTNNTAVRNTFRLRDSFTNEILLTHLGDIGETVYTFSITLNILTIVENTPTVFRRERRMYVEVFNQVCGSINSSNFTIRDRNPFFVILEIQCEQVIFATRTNSNRVFTEKDINPNSSTPLFFGERIRRDSSGNIVRTFLDVNPTTCPVGVGQSLLFIDARAVTNTFTITYFDQNNIEETVLLDNTVGRTASIIVSNGSAVRVESNTLFNYLFTDANGNQIFEFGRDSIFTPAISVSINQSTLVFT